MDDFISLLADAGDDLSSEENVKPLRLKTLCGQRLLHLCIESGRIRDVENLITCGISVHCKISDNKSALRRAFENGKDEIAALLIDSGADLDEKLVPHVSMLHCAIAKGFSCMVEALLDAGVSPNLPNSNGLSPLYLAAELNDDEGLYIAETLYSRGASEWIEAGLPLIHLAVARKSKIAIQRLSMLEFDMDITDSKLRTPIYRAAEMGDLEIVKELIGNGADLYCRDEQGQTMLHIAALGDILVAAKTLLDAGMDVNIKGTWWNWTPLHSAVGSGKTKLARFLIDRKASVSMKSEDGRSPLDLAKSNEDVSMINLLSNDKK